MHPNAPSLHVYERFALDHDNDSLTLLARQIPPAAVVLDLGMGTGGLGKYLAARQAVTLDGITLSHVEAQSAASIYRHAHVADLDTADLLQCLQGQTYDCIVCADVLEHLKHPERVLQQCHLLLKPGGQLLASVPNLAYAGLLADLMLGEFEYGPEGLLDNTHLRFFTRQSLQRFFARNGWQVTHSQVVTREVLSSEFKARFDQLPPAVSRHLLALPDAATYQFVWQLTPAAQPVANESLTPSPPVADLMPPTPALALFSAQLYAAVNGRYEEAHKLVCAGTMGGGVQTLRFNIPTLVKDGYTRLRLDPADRPGFMRLHALRIVTDRPSDHLWTWRGSGPDRDALVAAPQQQIDWSPPWGPSEQSWLQLTGDDPWIELPLSDHVLQTLSEQGGLLEMVATWPMSADYLQANQSLQALELKQSQLLARLQDAEAISRRVHDAELEKNRLAEHLSHQGETLRQTVSELNDTRQHLQRIQNSKLYRWTRPLAHFKYQLDALRGRHSATGNAKFGDIVASEADPSLTLLSQTLPSTPVDVIVPVYRGLEDTQRCILSALASPCQIAWNLVVINDCSPEPEVSQWLRDIAAQEPRITLLENEVNLGFVATVNRGMRLHPDRDVLLLNSDTEVANDWLDRIQRAAYARPQVASVTPFSNNATICSYPRFCQANDLPSGWTTQELDQLCAQHLSGQAVQVPTGNGFCMYIRRACLDAVGLFDVDNFGKGYGEENDFCVRAAAVGWISLHAFDTFVSHSGGVSFGDSKSGRELQAMETIRRLHPSYEREVHAYIKRDPASQARLILDLARLSSTKRVTILNVMHNRSGGSVRHLVDLARAFAGQAQFLTLTPADGGLRLSLQGQDEAFSLQWSSLQAAHWQHMVQTLRQLGVAHVHYHHLMGHAPQVASLHKLLSVSHDYTAHDYYSFCPQITLTDANDRYCGEQGLDQCQRCVQQRPAPMGLDIVAWRAASTPLLQTARYVMAPSQDAARRMQRFAPLARVVCAPHEQLLPAAEQPTPRGWSVAQRPLKVVVLGALSKIKGADTLEAVATLSRQQKAPIEFHLLGYGYRALRTQPGASLTVHGPYQDAELPELLRWLGADLAWFPAQCPETYSYTLSACLQAGLPVMASDLGALSERLDQRPWTWLIDWKSSPQQWLNHLLAVRGADPVAAVCCGSPPGADRHVTLLDYRSQYLPQPMRAEQSVDLKDLGASLYSLHGKAVDADLTTKSRLLRALSNLRNHPMLSPLVQKIPTHVQRRVKNLFVN